MSSTELWVRMALEDHVASFTRSDVEGLLAEIDHLRHVLAGEEKARDLLSKGMESQCELMDGLKQKVRKLDGELGQLRACEVCGVRYDRERSGKCACVRQEVGQ